MEGTDRGVSEVIGFVLIFGLIVISFSIYQGIVIPQQNDKAEFQHNQRVQGQLLELRDAILRTGASGVSQSVSITVGAEYPRRTFTVNFAVTGGSVRTVDPNPNGDSEILIQNITALDNETADFVDGTLNVSTRDIVYTPVYTHYAEAPETIIAGGGGAVFNEFDRTNLSVGNQVLITGRTITVFVIDGNLTKAKSGEGASVTVETEPLSVSTRTVTIENNASSRRINITIPTRVDNVTAWNESTLESQFGDSGQIYDVRSPREGYISVILEKDQYTLRMAKIGVGNDADEPEAKYLTEIDRPGGTVSENSSNRIVLEVRDEFNNPVDGFQVNASNDTGTGSGILSVVGETDTTTTSEIISANTSNGQVVFNYTAPDVTSRTRIALNFTIYDADIGYEQVWVNVSVLANGANDV